MIYISVRSATGNIYGGVGEFAKFGKANLHQASSLGIHLIVMMTVITIFFDLTQSNIVELIGGFKGGKC